MKIRYGTSGNPPNFFKSQFGKDRVNAPDWIRSIGLNAYERMMTYGARMKEDDAVELGKKAKLHDIFLSVHGPYYIVLTSDKPRVVKNSIKEMLKTIRLSNILGAERIVFHPGFGTNVKAVIKNLRLIEKNKPKTVTIHPEQWAKCLN